MQCLIFQDARHRFGLGTVGWETVAAFMGFVGNLRVMDQELFLAFKSRNNWLFSKFAKLPYISEHEYFAPREKTSFEDKKD